MKLINLLFISLLIGIPTFAEETESIDELLDTFVHNSDLSKKTRLENAGNVIIITRKELDRMQARNLKDVMKSLPTLNYSENRWAIPDPGYNRQELPFNSNAIRVYINDQEVSTASYGSGFFHVGDIDIGFVDHIEVYALNPSFEHSTEPARHLIKLYSKVPQRDKGKKVEVSIGSKGFNQESFQYSDIIDDVSIFAYVSRLDDQKKDYESLGYPLSRDIERYHLFSAFSTKGHYLQLQAIKSNKDMFMGLSPDGRTETAENESDYFHIGYENRTIENLKFSLVWENGTSKNQFDNLHEELKLTTGDDILTADLQYKWDSFDNNELIFGAKYRYKHFTMDKLEYMGMDLPRVDYDTQMISSLYFEDYYTLSENWLLSLGAQYSHVYNNAEVENQDVWMARFGSIYTDENWVYKTFLHQSEFLIEPYLYTVAITSVQPSINPEKTTNITQEIQYQNDAHKLRTVMGYSYLEDMRDTRSSTIYNDKDSRSILFAYMEYSYQFDTYNSFASNVSYRHNRNFEEDGSFDEYKAMIRFLNRFEGYEKFDFFNELIYNRNSFTSKNFFDYSAGVKYRHSDTLTFSLKGENIFDNARELYYERVTYDPVNDKWLKLEPLYASPIDQRIYFTLEYLF